MPAQANPGGIFDQAGRRKETLELKPEGRWPPNLLLSHAEGCAQIGTREVRTGTAVRRNGKGGEFFGGIEPGRTKLNGESWPDVSYGAEGGREVIPAWRCVDGCPVASLDAQSGVLHARGNRKPTWSGGGMRGGVRLADFGPGDEGGVSRFFPLFYAAKPSVREKNTGCEGLPIRTPEEMTGRKPGSAGLVMAHTDGSEKANPYAGTSGAPRTNHHPTVKGIALMRWLCRLITPPGGIVLDPFGGSGTTGVGALEEGFRAILIEREPDYVPIARARCEHAAPHKPPAAVAWSRSPAQRAISAF